MKIYFDLFDLFFGGREENPFSHTLRKQLETFEMLVTRGENAFSVQLLPLLLLDGIERMTNVSEKSNVEGEHSFSKDERERET